MNIQNDFTYACFSGNLENAKHILENNSNIDISKNNEYIFRKVCNQGHLRVAQWLLSVKPNINIYENDSYTFNACAAKWFQTLNPFKYSSVDVKINKKDTLLFML